MNIFHRANVWITVISDLFHSFHGSKARIMSPIETVACIKSGKSIIRFGDGEFGLAHGDSVHYQKWSPELYYAFEEIKKDYFKDPKGCPFLLAIPREFMTCSGIKLMKKREYIASWSRSRRDFLRSYPQDIVYGDAFLFEYKNQEIYRQIWDGAECIIFVHNSKKYADKFELEYGLHTQYIKCSASNAFEEIDILEEQIRDAINRNNWKIEQVTILISAGPAGKIVSYDLSKEGFHCIDTGHCWDSPLVGINS